MSDNTLYALLYVFNIIYSVLYTEMLKQYLLVSELVYIKLKMCAVSK